MIHSIKKQNEIEYGLYKKDENDLGWELVCNYNSVIVNDREMIDIAMLKAIQYMSDKGYEFLNEKSK